MILFSEDAITCIHRAALGSINAVDENHYLFLKKLSQVNIADNSISHQGIDKQNAFKIMTLLFPYILV